MTSTTGFVGETERGPTRPRLVTSWEDYQRWFGGYVDRAPFIRVSQVIRAYDPVHGKFGG